jgi:serine/threonine-protein kinase HipA
LGLVGNVRADLHDSIELEWLCMALIRECGLETANVEIGQFENQRVLIVERFDRRKAAGGDWWIRVPQEDFCQALGLPPSRKYEADGGPGVSRIMDVLRGSENAAADRVDFFRTQVLYWVMAATDGHAKNFSLVQLPGGRYRRTPLYDVLSTYPIQGRGANRLDPHDAKLAMAVEGRNRHYKLGEIHRWHWVAMGERLGLEQPVPELIDAICRRTPEAIDIVRDRLPPNFPMPVFNAVEKGLRGAAAKLMSEPDRRRSG